jgi:hypothetical protein
MHMAGKGPGEDEVASALRTVTPDKAFAFYSETGETSRCYGTSLDEFATFVVRAVWHPMSQEQYQECKSSYDQDNSYCYWEKCQSVGCLMGNRLITSTPETKLLKIICKSNAERNETNYQHDKSRPRPLSIHHWHWHQPPPSM